MQQQQDLLLDQPLIIRLYQKHFSGLFAFLLKQTGSREDAEDLLLEVFLVALEYPSLDKLNPDQQQAWLWSIARRKAADYYREKTRHPKIRFVQIEEQLYEDENMAPEEMALKQEKLDQLHQHIRRLPVHQQEILGLRFGQGLRCAEIAMVLGKKEGAVRMLLSRTLHTLRNFYQFRERKDSNG